MTRKGKQLVGVIGDIHVPFQDKRSTKLALDYLSSLKLDKLVLIGDLFDFLSISSYRRTLLSRANLSEELEQAKEFLSDLRKKMGRGVEMVYLKGNHEDRWNRYLSDRAPELEGVNHFDLKSILDLKSFNIKWVPKKWIYNGMIFYHGDGRCSRNSGYTVTSWIRHFKQSTIIGHIHRLGVVYNRCGDGRVMVGIENGCLCEMDPDYEKSGTSDWQHGGTVLEMDINSHVNFPHQFQILGSKVYGCI